MTVAWGLASEAAGVTREPSLGSRSDKMIL